MKLGTLIKYGATYHGSNSQAGETNSDHSVQGSEIAEWLAHWLLVLEVPGSIPAGGEENLLVRTCFPSCHLQE